MLCYVMEASSTTRCTIIESTCFDIASTCEGANCLSCWRFGFDSPVSIRCSAMSVLPFDLITVVQSACEIWSFYLQPFQRYGGDPKISKVGNMTLPSPFYIILHSFRLYPLHAKFEVSSSNRSWDMQGVPKFKKEVTWPLHDLYIGGRWWPHIWIRRPRFASSSIQLSWGYDDE